MTITAAQFTRGFTSSAGITARIKDSTVTIPEKLLRYFLMFVSGGFSEASYVVKEEMTALEFRSKIGDPLVKASIHPKENNDKRFIEVDTEIGKIKIEETGDDEHPLKGTLTGHDSTESGFDVATEMTTLESFQKALEVDIEIIAGPYADYDLSGEFGEPQFIRDDLIMVNGKPRLFPGRFQYDNPKQTPLWQIPGVAQAIVEANVTKVDNNEKIEVDSKLGKIYIEEKDGRLVGEIKLLARHKSGDVVNSWDLGEATTIADLKMKNSLQGRLDSKGFDPFEIKKSIGKGTPYGISFDSIKEQITSVAFAPITNDEKNGRQIKSDIPPFGEIEITQMEKDGTTFLAVTWGDGKLDTKEFTTLESLQINLAKVLIEAKGLKSMSVHTPTALKLFNQLDKNNKEIEIDLPPFGKIKITETQEDNVDCLNATLNNVEISTKEILNLNELRIYLQNKLIEKKDNQEPFFTKSPSADVRTQYGVNGTIKYELPDGQHGVVYVEFPPEIEEGGGGDEESKSRSGGYKTLTHQNEEYVGFTIHNNNVKVTFNQKLLDFIIENELNTIVPQIRVDEKFYISKNLGSLNLWERIMLPRKNEKRYTFDPSHWRSAASDLDKLHGAGIIHRDLKAENLFFRARQIYITDLDTMVKVKKSTEPVFRNEQFPKATEEEIKNNPRLAFKKGTYESDNKTKDSPVNGFKKDQLDILLTMMESKFCDSSQQNFVWTQKQIQEFVESMPCAPRLKQELSQFLTNPIDNKLSSPLAVYLSK